MTSSKYIRAALIRLCFTFLLIGKLAAQKTHEVGQLIHKIEKLGVAGSVMYIAAHPDDENQQFLSYMANEKKVRTAYLSLTRGDGGQNLIGKEQNEAVGLLRTQELLKARTVDGAEQYFTRAIDFGYSKTTEEALEFWQEDSILYDVVHFIRAFQPDIIVTRFPPDKRAGHGHHSASAVLAMKAYSLAANPNAFPEQLEKMETWQVRRIYWNFYNRGFTNTPPQDGDFVQMELGGYNTLLGKSYPEIAARARSEHRSQGFGAAARRGKRTETFKYLVGDKAKKDLLEDINLSWSRYPGGELVDRLHKTLVHSFDVHTPSASIPTLFQLKEALSLLPHAPIKQQKLQEIDQIILGCAGVFLEAVATDYIYTPTEEIRGSVEFLHQLNSKVNLKVANKSQNQITNNEFQKVPFKVTLNSESTTQPYWLKEERQRAIFNRPLNSINKAFDKEVLLPIELTIEGQPLILSVPIIHKFVEPARGAVYKKLEIRPALSINPTNEAAIWIDNTTKIMSFDLIANQDNINGAFSLELPLGWTAEPQVTKIQLEKQGDRQRVEVAVRPNKKATSGIISSRFKTNNSVYTRSLVEIEYPHIPNTSYFPKAEIKAIKLNLETKGKNIGYVMGAGDKVPLSLQELGYKVRLLKESDFTMNLKEYDAIVIGIRAYNVHNWLSNKSDDLKEYMNQGGRVVVQYQTSRIPNTIMNAISPYEMKLGRSRVSEEDAQVKFLIPDHPLLNFPNKIGLTDFDHWVQERGLYFAEEWEAPLTPILSMNDKGEEAKKGSVLYAEVGKGSYIYTGLSFFRELPAGVEGAYKFWANLVSVK